MLSMLERRFALAAHGTTVRTEVVAGITTFLTMAYVVFVQPAVLGAAGMDVGAVLVATCFATALATLLMAFLANYPIAVAPAMGHNFFFAYTVVLGMEVPWQAALGAVALAGAVFVLTAGVGLRERIIAAIPDGLRHAIAAGIGLLIAMIGLQWAGVVVASTGTLVGVGTQAGLMRNGTLPRAREALLADAVGTVAGAALGTSTVTAYIESGAGVAAGGRTGLASVVTALLFLGALFASPLVHMVAGGYASDGATVYPTIAAPLILVGTFMMGGLRHVAWDDPTEAIPAFLTLVMMPLAASITEGVAFGGIAYVALKAATGRIREVHHLLRVCAALFVARYALLR